MSLCDVRLQSHPRYHAAAEMLSEAMSREALPCHSTRKSSAFRGL